MTLEMREALLHFIKKHTLNLDYTLHDLFMGFYAEEEFKDIDDLINGIDEFFDFFINHITDIKFDNSTIHADMLLKEIEDGREYIKNIYHQRNIKNQTRFTDSIINSLKTPSEISLLDVGTGFSAISSLLFAKKLKKVTAMDTHFMLSTLALKNMNVHIVHDYFNNETDISNYDIVVGRAPCSAIEPIVYNCSKHNKPYIIMLCDCNLKPQLKQNTDSLGWENVLPQIDPNIKFSGDYAYNVQSLQFNDSLLKRFSIKLPKYENLKQSKNIKKSSINQSDIENFQSFYMDYFN